MVLPELRALANEVGVKGTSGMRKNELIAAIRERRGEPIDKARNGGSATTDNAASSDAPANGDERARIAATRRPRHAQKTSRTRRKPTGASPAPSQPAKKPSRTADETVTKRKAATSRAARTVATTTAKGGRAADGAVDSATAPRRRERGGGDGGGEAELREDDVVQPVAGILDVLDNYAFVRTSGYLAGPNDVYVSMNMVRKNGLRRGDHITGAVRVPQNGERRQIRGRSSTRWCESTLVNGGPVEDARKRPEFGKLTPLYPNERLRLETTTERLTTRVIDLIMPVGKGQRALIVSPPKAGKTTILQDIANAITRNNPECHLMVVLVDERPEEVTDMQRSVKGEVIASTFDRPPSDHTWLPSSRSSGPSGSSSRARTSSCCSTRSPGWDARTTTRRRPRAGSCPAVSTRPRCIRRSGSSARPATSRRAARSRSSRRRWSRPGSTGDTVIFEEFKGTGNAELKLDRKIAERRVFPAVDVNPSGTRKDELLLSPDEFAIVHKLRRVLSGLDSHQAIDLLMAQLRKTKNNYEFLVQVSKNAPGPVNEEFASPEQPTAALLESKAAVDL